MTSWRDVADALVFRMSESVSWEYDGNYGSIRFHARINPPMSDAFTAHEPAGSIAVDEPYRETSGHSAWISATAARELAAKLIEFADAVEPTPPGTRSEEDEK